MGPVYEDDAHSAPLLASAYRSSLQLANEQGLKTVAFPAISCGVFGYPYAKAAEVGGQRAFLGGRRVWSRSSGQLPSCPLLSRRTLAMSFLLLLACCAPRGRGRVEGDRVCGSGKCLGVHWQNNN